VVTTTTVKPSPTALSSQALLDAISLPGAVPVGTDDPNLTNPRYSLPSAGLQAWRVTPGQVETRNGDGTYAAGYGPWVEISSTSWANPGDVKVQLTGRLYSLSRSTGQWTQRYAWGTGQGGWAPHLWTWQTELGTVAVGDQPAGWGSADNQGDHFGDQLADNQAPGGKGFVRVHGWGTWWTGSPWSTFWTSTDPSSDHSTASLAKLDDLAGIVHVLEVRLVGSAAAIAASHYAISSGWDTYWQGADVVHPVNRTGSGSGFRKIAPTSAPQLVVTSTLSADQVRRYPLTSYAGGWAA
jgi:hypothetical protein